MHVGVALGISVAVREHVLELSVHSLLDLGNGVERVRQNADNRLGFLSNRRQAARVAV